VKTNIQGIKRKTTDKTVSPISEHRRKQIENVKKVSKKNMKKISKEKVNSKAIEQIEEKEEAKE
jgi:hypothetical protein